MYSYFIKHIQILKIKKHFFDSNSFFLLLIVSLKHFHAFGTIVNNFYTQKPICRSKGDPLTYIYRVVY